MQPSEMKEDSLHSIGQSDIYNIPEYIVRPDNGEDIELPLLYKTYPFFESSTYYHPEISFHTPGLISSPKPYMVRNDDSITALLLACLMMTILVISFGKKIIKQRTQTFFSSRLNKDSLPTIKTASERRYNLLLQLQAGILAGFFFFNYTQTKTDFFMISVSPQTLLAIYSIICWIYIGIKRLLYQFINWIFFDKEKRNTWFKSYSFLLSVEGFFLFPLALISVFFNLPEFNAILYFCILIIVIRLLLLYKTFCIFFPNFHGFTHLIVYFCALEILPIYGLWQALTYINDILL